MQRFCVVCKLIDLASPGFVVLYGWVLILNPSMKKVKVVKCFIELKPGQVDKVLITWEVRICLDQ